MRVRPVFLIISITALVSCVQLPVEKNVDSQLTRDKQLIVERLSKSWLVKYSPSGEEAYGWGNFSRIIYPSDFVEKYPEYKKNKTRPLVIWTGIITEKSGLSERFTIKHHFWDWNTTSDEHLIYISSIGDGVFECSFDESQIETSHELNQFVIVYGLPLSVDPVTGVINMECLKTKILKKRYFTINAWSYGREYVENNNINDVKVLSTEYE